MMEQMEIYQKLKQLRKERGLTLSTFAEKIGSDYQQVSRIERGKCKLSIDMLMKMSDALDTPISEIVQPSSQEKTVPFSVQEVATVEIGQQLLTKILEKIEVFVSTNHIQISPVKKAQAATQIYNEALDYHKKTQDLHAVEKLIDFSIGLIKTILQEK